MKRNDWNAVYANQKKVLAALAGVDAIFLGGGTAVQRYTIPVQYRESEDLDFFTDHFMQAGESAKVAREVVHALRKTGVIEILNSVTTEQGTHRILCGFADNDEVVKIELLNFTAERFGDLGFLRHNDFPRIENNYNLLLYKLKALCDREETVKDLFDLYFIFREIGDVPIREMFTDLKMKFQETTGYEYRPKHVFKALKASTRAWDIIPTNEAKKHWHSLQDAVNEFRLDMISTLIDPAADTINFTCDAYLKEMIGASGSATPLEYLDFFEKNPFIETECRRYIASLSKAR